MKTRIAMVLYDGGGEWIEIRFSNGEKFRYASGFLFRLAQTVSDEHQYPVSIQEGEVEKRP